MNIIVAFLLYACTVVFCSLLLYSSTKITKKFSSDYTSDCLNALDAALQSGNQQVFNDYYNNDVEANGDVSCWAYTYLECNGNEQYPKIYINISDKNNYMIPIPDIPINNFNQYEIEPAIIDLRTNVMSFQCQIRTYNRID